MTHDPLCPIGQMKDSPGVADLMESGWKDCFMCKVIAAADARGRGHERDEAAQRISAADSPPEWVLVIDGDPRPAAAWLMATRMAIAAARGEQS